MTAGMFFLAVIVAGLLVILWRGLGPELEEENDWDDDWEDPSDDEELDR